MKKAFLFLGILLIVFGILKTGIIIPQLNNFSPEATGYNLYTFKHSFSQLFGPVLFIIIGGLAVFYSLKKEKE